MDAIELLTANEMCTRLKISFDTFRKTWKRWRHERIGTGHTLKSMRFYWHSGPILAETDDGDCEVSNKKWNTLASGDIRQRRACKKQSRVHEPQRSIGLGGRIADIEAAAKRFGLA